MRSRRGFTIAAALTIAVGCGGGVDRAPGAEEGGGGANGIGDDARPTPAERTGAASPGMTGGLSEEARQFVQKASMANQMEVALGNLAEDKAQSDQVQQFGERLARDHESANRELQSSIGGGDATKAQQPGGGVSNQPDRAVEGTQAPGGELAQARQQMQQTQQRLESVAGQAFDRAYLEEMIKHHQHDIQEFERAAQSDNPQIRAYAERTLPTLREHLQRAQQLQTQGQGSQPGQGR